MLLTSVTNVGILRSAPGHTTFSSFVSDAYHPTHFCCNVITDDEGDNEFNSDDDNDTTWTAANPTVDGFFIFGHFEVTEIPLRSTKGNAHIIRKWIKINLKPAAHSPIPVEPIYTPPTCNPLKKGLNRSYLEASRGFAGILHTGYTKIFLV
jgi:hypothetical protein